MFLIYIISKDRFRVGTWLCPISSSKDQVPSTLRSALPQLTVLAVVESWLTTARPCLSMGTRKRGSSGQAASF